MTKEQYAEWKEKNGTGSERVYINDIAYNLVTMKDKWIAVFSVRNGEYIGDCDYCTKTDSCRFNKYSKKE